MGRKSQTSKGLPRKNITIKSNSLVPARPSGEKPFVAMVEPRIKTEADTVMNCSMDISTTETFSFLNDCNSNFNINAESGSNHSTLTEPMEADQETVESSNTEDFPENKVMPTSLAAAFKKLEPTGPEIPNNKIDDCNLCKGNIISSFNPEKLTILESILSMNTEISVANPSFINPCVKSEPIEDGEISQNVTNESDSNKSFHIKSETVEMNQNIAEAQSSSNNQEEVTAKRKLELASNLKIIKKIKREGFEVKSEKENSDDEDIVVLPVPKVEKNFTLITISDEENDDSQNVDMEIDEQSSSSRSINEKDFSKDILKYFCIQSELDRHECKSALDYVLKSKTKKNTLEEMFPIIKKENRKTFEIKEGDILYKRSATEAHFNVEHPSVSSCVATNISNGQEPATQSPQPFKLNSNAGECTFQLSLEGMNEAIRIFGNINKTIPANANSSVAAPELCQQFVQNPLFQKSESSVSNTVTANPQLQFQLTVQPALKYDNVTFSLQPSTLNWTTENTQAAEKLHNREFQRLALSSTSSLSTSVSATPVRDPRLAHKQEKFAPRKGTEYLELYLKIGKDDVTKYYKTLILQWNPSWVRTQLKTGNYPPICDFYPTVKHSYNCNVNYYNTYIPLHLLNVWFTLFNCWKNSQGIDVVCTVQTVERTDNFITYSCSNEMEDSRVWPKGDDIVWCKHNNEEAFLRVEDVKKKLSNVEKKKKLRISLDTLHDLKLKPGDIIRFCILLNMRTAVLEAESLKMLDDRLKELVLRPQLFKDDISVVVLRRNKNIKELRDEILNAAFMNRAHVVVVDTNELESDIQLEIIQVLITKITYALLNNMKYQMTPGKAKVLVLLKSTEILFQLYRHLIEYDPILAIRTKQFHLSPELLGHTLEYQVERKGNVTDVFKKHNIFLTTFSAFGKVEKMYLSKHNRWNCIIYDAHMCTELETAVPMTLKIRKLFLLGNKNSSIPLPPMLRAQNYHCTLFDRLLIKKLQK